MIKLPEEIQIKHYVHQKNLQIWLKGEKINEFEGIQEDDMEVDEGSIPIAYYYRPEIGYNPETGLMETDCYPENELFNFLLQLIDPIKREEHIFLTDEGEDFFYTLELPWAWIKPQIQKIYADHLPIRYGTSHLEKQSVRLGSLVMGEKDFYQGKEYCIVDTGIGEWNSGYKFLGFDQNRNYIFRDTLNPSTMDDFITFSRDEIVEMIKGEEIAFEN